LFNEAEVEIEGITGFKQEFFRCFEEEREKPKKYAQEVTMKAHKLQEQIAKHFEHQGIENDKMQKDISDLKGDKMSIQQALIGTILLASLL
jgi:hypothetical protein